MYSILKPQAGPPPVVGIPILTGGPTKTMDHSLTAESQVAQPQYVQVQGQPKSNCTPNATA